MNEWWMLALGVLTGVVAGSIVMFVAMRARWKGRVLGATEEAHRYAASAQKAKAALLKLQAEIDASRAALSRPIAGRVNDPAVVLARTEERLRAAYDELDLLRRRPAQDSETAELTDGFAATRPMYDAM